MENRRSMTLDFSKIHTYSAENRHNLVRIDNLKRPGQYQPGEWGGADFDALIGQLRRAKAEGRQIILSMGAHVVKCGLSPYLIALMREGYITHIAGNGACSIHDFELACLGGTSEDVPTAIEDGSFGMWEQTGAWMNEAIQRGATANIGYGEALARYIDEHPDRFPYKDDCVLYQAYRMDIPATYHIALGTDIIHQHPSVDFAAIGKASGIDFHKMCYSVAHLDNRPGGVPEGAVHLSKSGLSHLRHHHRQLRPDRSGRLPPQDRLRKSAVLLSPPEEHCQPPGELRRPGLALLRRSSADHSQPLRETDGEVSPCTICLNIR